MSGWNLLCDAALKATLVMGAAWAVVWMLRSRSAAARHLVWTGAAAAVLALPLLVLSMPALRVPAGTLPIPGLTLRVTGSASEAAAPSAPPSATSRTRTAHPDPAAAWRRDPRLWMIAAWAAGTALALAQMILAWIALVRLRRAALPFPAGAPCGSVPVLETRACAMPMTGGLFRPAIFLPAEARQWSEERRGVVLLHELAHVRRGDAATNLLARLALCLYWWNPLAWIAWREFLKERERAADDLVLSSGASASDYASHLLDLARSLRPAAAWASAAVSMARPSQLEGRLLAILDSGVRRGSTGRRAPWAAVLVALAVVAPLASLRAQNARRPATPPPMPPDVEATLRAAQAQRDPAVLDRAATAFETMHQYDMAGKMREAALALHGEVSGKTSVEYQVELVRLGALMGKMSNGPANQESYYTQAVALGDRPESAEALLNLGMRAYGKGDANALEFFQRALNVAPGGAEAGRALTWMAVLRQKDDAAGAEDLFQRALAAEGADSPEVAVTLDLYARFLGDRGRTAEAEAAQARAAAIHREGVANMPAARTGGSQAQPAVKVGGGVTAPTLVFKVEPYYSQEARAAKLQGMAVLSVVVEPDGKPSDIQLKKSLGLGLDEMAVDAISQWRFKPGLQEGRPVPVMASIEVNFRLE